MRIALVTSSIAAYGGASRSMAEMANYFADVGWKVAIVTMDSGEKPPARSLAPTIEHRALDLLGRSPNPLASARNVWRRYRTIKRCLDSFDPDVTISFFCWINVLVLLARRGKTPVLVSERGVPAMEDAGRLWSKLRRLTYPTAASVVVLTEQALDYFSSSIRERATIIPISIDASTGDTATAETAPGQSIVGLGRLAPEKNFGALIRAFAKTNDQYPDWELVIWGEGSERDSLEALVAELGVKNRIRLPGRTEKPLDALAAGSIFAHTAKFEGFGYVFLEAMACGLPVAAYACPGGPREIIVNEETGLLVEPDNETAMAEALIRLMNDGGLREKMGLAGRERVELYSPDAESRRWHDAVVAACPGAKP